MTAEVRVAGLPVGYLTHVSGRTGAAQVYRETVELAVAAEQLGFGSFWVAQHHLGGLEGLLPSPLVLLAAVAERTCTIRLGTAVVAAGMEDPLRLAEDAAVVDVLSGGRLELGIGAGADPAASVAFGRDHARRHADCTAAVDALCAALEGPALVPAASGLRGRLWWATGSPEGTRAAGERGIGVLSGRARSAGRAGPGRVLDARRRRAPGRGVPHRDGRGGPGGGAPALAHRPGRPVGGGAGGADPARRRRVRRAAGHAA